VATAALLVIAWVPPLWHYRTQARATGLEMARVEAELVPLRRLESRTAECSVRLKQMQEEIGMLRRLLASKSSWTSLLANLQHHLAVAEDAWLERLQVAGASPVRPQTDGSRAAPLRLEVSGRLLNRHAPLEKVGIDSWQRVKTLLDGLRNSPAVAGIEDERFDASQPGILRFEFILVAASQLPL
jgi:type IV pilus assembly protein PilM